MIDTKVKSKVVTNTQILAAVLAAFMAGGLAFASAPASKSLSKKNKCGVNSTQVVQAIKGCTRGQYSGIDFTCYDGTAHQFRPEVCTSASKLRDYANRTCANSCSGNAATTSSVPVATGSLEIQVDNDTASFQHPHFVLAGDRAMVGRLKLTAGAEEAVQIETLTLRLNNQGNFSDLLPVISSFELYSDAGMRNRVVSFAPNVFAQNNEAQLSGLNLHIPAGSHQYLYIGMTTHPFGPLNFIPEEGIDLSFQPAAHNGVVARGVRSAQEIFPTGDTRIATPLVSIVPLKITNVQSTFDGGPLQTGNQTLFSFEVTADAGDNTNHIGDILSAEIQEIQLELQTNLALESLVNLDLCRVDSGTCMDVFLNTSTHGFHLVSLTGNQNISFSDFESSFDRLVDSGESVEYELRGTVLNAPEGSSLQTRLGNLDNGGLIYGYDRDGDETYESIFEELRLETRGTDYPFLVGRALNN